MYSLVVRALGLEYGDRELESRSLHLKPETKLREERGLSGCRKGLKTVPLAQAWLSLKPAKTTIKHLCSSSDIIMVREICSIFLYYINPKGILQTYLSLSQRGTTSYRLVAPIWLMAIAPVGLGGSIYTFPVNVGF